MDDLGGLVLVELVLDLADELLEDVLHGRQAGGDAVLVDDEGHVGALLLEELLELVDRLGFRNEEHLVLDQPQVLRGRERPRALEQILDVDHADGRFQVGLAQWIPRVAGLHDDRDVLVERPFQ